MSPNKDWVHYSYVHKSWMWECRCGDFSHAANWYEAHALLFEHNVMGYHIRPVQPWPAEVAVS